jgi:hypothetical protein
MTRFRVTANVLPGPAKRTGISKIDPEPPKALKAPAAAHCALVVAVDRTVAVARMAREFRACLSALAVVARAPVAAISLVLSGRPDFGTFV